MASPKISADVARIASRFELRNKYEFRGETTLVLSTEAIHDVAAFCKGELGYSYLLDLSGVDNFGEDPRFEVVYELYHLERGDHLRLKVLVSEEKLEVPTVSDVWPTANWHEREAYDMYGVKFSGHPDLRRILMWEGYPFFPLRKDFPLAGRPSDMPDVAFTGVAPLAGGPFVTTPSTATTKDREPRSREIS
jgi:NADH-quinone oxidoreductase subunit C